MWTPLKGGGWTSYQIFKNHTYVKKVGTYQNFYLAFIDKLEKKNCWSAPIILMLYFQKKIKKNTRRYNYFTPVYQKSWWYDLQFLKYRIKLTEIGNYGSFFVLLPTTLKPFLKKWKKLLETWSFYTSVPKTQSYEVWFLRYVVRQTEFFFVILGQFLPFYPLTTPENQNFDKMKKHLEMSSFYTCICIYIHDSHIMHGSWDMKCNRHNFLSFWATFFNFAPIAAQKIKIKKKNAWRYHHFTQVYQKSWSYYAILFLRFGTWQM